MRRPSAPTAVALALVCAPACKRTELAAAAPTEAADAVIELSPEGMKNAQIETRVATPHAFSPRLIAAATIVADPQHMARVGAHLAGRVVKIHVRLGDVVTRGQALVSIDTVEIHHVSTDYLTSLARAGQANDELERQRHLVAERVGARQELKRAEAAADAANAALREAEEHLHFLGLRDADIEAMKRGSAHDVVFSVLRAPIAGRVEAIHAALGQVLTGTEDLLTIIQSDEVFATLRVYERDLPQLKPGAAVTFQVTSYPERAFGGQVISVSDLVDPITRTVEVRASLDPTGGALKPGMSAVAAIALPGVAAGIWLPAEAVQQHAGARVVFAQVGERRFTPRQVATGPERGGFVPVLAGLSEGTEVVVRGAFALRGELERAELQGD